MERFFKTRFVLIICLVFGLGFALSSVVQAQGEQGCGPGFWKQEQHSDFWVNRAPDDLFYEVFGIAEADRLEIRLKKKDGGGTTTNPTLLEALNAPGGGINALTRQAVAALLDAENPDVDYSLPSLEVILMFQAAFADGSQSAFVSLKNTFETLNELGCPLNADEI